MSDVDPNDRDRVLRLMMAALDGEIDGAGRAELDALLRSEAGLRSEWDRLRGLKEVTAMMTLKKPPEEVWDRYWVSVYNRLERGVGWVLVSIGAVVVGSYGLWSAVRAILRDAMMPWVLKGALLLLIVGGVMLLVSVVREKYFTHSRDAYKEVER